MTEPANPFVKQYLMAAGPAAASGGEPGDG